MIYVVKVDRPCLVVRLDIHCFVEQFNQLFYNMFYIPYSIAFYMRVLEIHCKNCDWKFRTFCTTFLNAVKKLNMFENMMLSV